MITTIGRTAPPRPAATFFALVLATLAAEAAASQGMQYRHHRLRSLRDVPFPTDVAGADQLHTEAMRRARVLEQLHGHVRPVSPPLPRVSPIGLRSHAAGTPINPTAFGADPTGQHDSTTAMTAAVAALLTIRGPRHTMASNITDLGGATLDLSGGTYLISAPIVIPAMFGNLQIVRGTLRASATFPAARWLVEIGDAACVPRLASGVVDVQGSCGQFVNLNQMLFDAAHVAAGGVRVTKTMGTTIGPSVFFTGFTLAGVRIDGGHECMIQQAWFAECEWSDARGSVCQEDPNGPGGNKSTSIGVQINGNDHFLTDVIVFEFTHIGVEINGAANLLQGVHTWNAAVYDGGYAWKGGVGIAVNSHQTRLMACYLDYSSLSVVDPTELVVEATFFLAAPAVFSSSGATTISGVYMHGNTYAVGGDSIRLDTAFLDGTDCTISEDIGDSPKTTVASRTITHTAPSTEWVATFPELLLPLIEQVEYSFTAASSADPWVQHRAIKGNGTIPSVTVQTSVAVRGTVTIRVNQAIHGVRAVGNWINQKTGQCLDTNGDDTEDGTPVDVWACVPNAKNEEFLHDKLGHLVGQNSRKCLSTHGCSGGAHTCIQPCTIGEDLWNLTVADLNGQQTIRPRLDSSQCVAIGDAGVVMVMQCAEPPTSAQLWSQN
eukprot:m.174645 g.174645  ORF g.174645 m.174645 type:complete len:662 (-) comp24362_c0_seq1:222-2207(-)